MSSSAPSRSSASARISPRSRNAQALASRLPLSSASASALVDERLARIGVHSLRAGSRASSPSTELWRSTRSSRSAIASFSFACHSAAVRSPCHHAIVLSRSSASYEPMSSSPTTASNACSPSSRARRRSASRYRIACASPVRARPFRRRSPAASASAHRQLHLDRDRRQIAHPPGRLCGEVPSLERRLELQGLQEQLPGGRQRVA